MINSITKVVREGNGCKLLKNNLGAFWVICKIGRIEFCQRTQDETLANKIFLEKSGLPERYIKVNKDDINVYLGKTTGSANNWRRIDRVYLRKKEIGKIIIKNQGEEIFSRVGNEQVEGYDMDWILAENGYRMEPKSEHP